MSYADVASRGPKQTAEEAAAPQLPEVIPTIETASTSSLIDVDSTSVRTVPSDFFEQEVQTKTQAARIEREEVAAEEAAAKVEAKAYKAKHEAAHAAHDVNSWLTQRFASLSDGAASAIVAVNLAGVVAASAWLTYRAWGLYESNRLSWRSVAVGVGLVGLLSAAEVTLGRYMYKTKGTKH